MASPKHKKANNNSLVEMDLISNLPEDMKQKILNYLHIKEAGRTSILSSKWRHTWTSIPELVIDEDTIVTADYTGFVDTIFLLHNGPIRKFNLVTEEDDSEAIDRWIGNLSRNGIRELTIHVCRDDEYVMHSGFFSCEELNYINLAKCSFKLPLNFKGFKLLNTLALNNLKVSISDIEKLVSSSPQLKELILAYLGKSGVLHIHAPNLQILDICSEFLGLQVCAPKLRSLYVWMLEPAGNQPCKFEQVVANVSALERFEFGGYFSQYLCDEPFGVGFSPTFNRLENLDFVLDFANEKDARFVVAMFRRTPHLKSFVARVELMGTTLPASKLWEAIDRREGLFTHLQAVHIVGFMAVDSILSFVEFIVGSAPQLVTLTLERDPEDKQDVGSMLKKQLQDEVIMLRQILGFERASPKAKIVFQ